VITRGRRSRVRSVTVEVAGRLHVALQDPEVSEP
jgi:hypothetical protein